MTQAQTKGSGPKLPDLSKIEKERQKLQAVRHDIETFVFEREDAIKMAILTLLAQEHAILVGPPGVAKSMIVNQLTNRITGAKMFEILMHPQLTANDLFVSHTTVDLTTDPLTGAQSMCTRYHTDGGVTLATAEIYFGDEVYKCNPRTLNSLLTLINERRYDLNRQRYDAALISAFFASNELPEVDGSDGLAAFHDRILVRLPTDPIKQLDNKIKVFTTQLAHRRNLVQGTVAPMKTIDLAELKKLQDMVPLIYIPKEVLERVLKLADMVSKQTDIYISQRRLEKSLRLLQARALFAGRPQVSMKDLTILRYVLWEEPEKFDATEKIIRDNVLDPVERRMTEIKNSAFELIRSAEKKVADGDWFGRGIMEEFQGVMGCLEQLEELRTQSPKFRSEIDVLNDEINDAKNAIISNLGRER